MYVIDLLTLVNNLIFEKMGKSNKDDLTKLGHKINQLKKRILRTKISGKLEKVEFRKMRINKIKKHIQEIISKKKKK